MPDSANDQTAILRAAMGRIRAAAESDADLKKLTALRDFLLRETDVSDLIEPTEPCIPLSRVQALLKAALEPADRPLPTHFSGYAPDDEPEEPA